MRIKVADQLPPSRICRRHSHRLHLSWIERDSWRHKALINNIVPVPVRDVCVEAHVPQIPYHIVIYAHLEGWVVREDVSVHWKEIGSHAAGDLRRVGVIDELRVPNGLVARRHCRVFVAFVEACRIDGWKIFLHVVECEEGVGFLVVSVEDDEFTVLGHRAVHFAGGVDDNWTAETGVLVLVHRDCLNVSESLQTFHFNGLLPYEWYEYSFEV